MADLGIRIIHNLLKKFENNKEVQHVMIPLLMPTLLEAFTNDVFKSNGRARILHLFYTMIRMITWADAIDN